jgi:pantoate--beta-alanine ligase
VNDMLTVSDPAVMRRWATNEHKHGRRIVLVPTMGYLHDGHLSLVKEARRHGNRVVVSIFVNPTQFAPNEDLERYPRDLAGDFVKLRESHADVVFTPDAKAVYGPGFDTWVVPESLAAGLCGRSRPTHFRGVATVVMTLLRITLADAAVFGEKDYQQLQIIRRMVRDLWLDVEIIGMPTVREKDGLAMSSRNAFLSEAERQAATKLFAALTAIQAAHKSGEKRAEQLLSTGSELLRSAPGVKLDYLEIVDAENLSRLETVERGAVVMIAAFVGLTRLIDNIRLVT